MKTRHARVSMYVVLNTNSNDFICFWLNLKKQSEDNKFVLFDVSAW